MSSFKSYRSRLIGKVLYRDKDMCPTCIAEKDIANTYARCGVCKNWRTMTDIELIKVEKRKNG